MTFVFGTRVHFCFLLVSEKVHNNYTTLRNLRRKYCTTRPEHYTTFGPQMSIEVYVFGRFLSPEMCDEVLSVAKPAFVGSCRKGGV